MVGLFPSAQRTEQNYPLMISENTLTATEDSTVGAEPAEAAKTRPPMSVLRKASMAACGKPG